MARVKGGTVTRRRRKKYLKLAKGYFGAKSTNYKMAKEAVMKSYMYAFRDRRKRKRDFRRLWITRINAAARVNGLSYSRLMNGLHQANIDINRKMLADIAINDPEAFATICDQAKQVLGKQFKPKRVTRLIRSYSFFEVLIRKILTLNFWSFSYLCLEHPKDFL